MGERVSGSGDVGRELKIRAEVVGVDAWSNLVETI